MLIYPNVARPAQRRVLSYLEQNEPQNVRRYLDCGRKNRCETRFCERCAAIRSFHMAEELGMVDEFFKRFRPGKQVLSTTLRVQDIPHGQLSAAIPQLYAATNRVLQTLRPPAAYQQTEIEPSKRRRGLYCHPHVHIAIWDGPSVHTVQNLWKQALTGTSLQFVPCYVQTMHSAGYLDYITKPPDMIELTNNPQWFQAYADAVNGQKLRRLRVSKAFKQFRASITTFRQLIAAGLQTHLDTPEALLLPLQVT